MRKGPAAPKFNLTGQRFGKWEVLGVGEYSYTSIKQRWHCRCECGRESHIPTGDLRNGESLSCTHCKRLTHGQTGSAEYWVWHGMKKRCFDQNNLGYKDYGGRGIVVCDRWRNSFSNFISDMGLRPSPELSIERINNNGHYEPANCKWGTDFEQNRNKRSNRMIEINGTTKCLRDWARGIPLSDHAFSNRLVVGLTGDALFAPAHKGRPHMIA